MELHQPSACLENQLLTVLSPFFGSGFFCTGDAVMSFSCAAMPARIFCLARVSGSTVLLRLLLTGARSSLTSFIKLNDGCADCFGSSVAGAGGTRASCLRGAAFTDCLLCCVRN